MSTEQERKRMVETRDICLREIRQADAFLVVTVIDGALAARLFVEDDFRSSELPALERAARHLLNAEMDGHTP